jgi:hypothetical protein
MSNGRGTHHQASMPDVYRTYQQVRQALNQPGLSFHDDHFEAGVMIEMRMDRGEDCFVVFMLNVRQFFGQKRLWWS